MKEEKPQDGERESDAGAEAISDVYLLLMMCNRYRTSSKISRAPSVTGIGTVFSGGSPAAASRLFGSGGRGGPKTQSSRIRTEVGKSHPCWV